MTRKQYAILLELFHQYNAAFQSLDEKIKELFFDYLYCRKDWND